MERDKKESAKQNADYSGYSEKQNDLNAEIIAGEWQSLTRYRTYQNRSRQGKIIAMYQAVSNRLNQLVGMYYKLVGDNPNQGEKLLKELRKLRYMQEILLNCLAWEKKGKIERDMVPPEIWDLIE